MLSATIIVTLAISLGPTAAVIGMADALFFRPLPVVAGQDRLLRYAFGTPMRDGLIPHQMSYANLAEIRNGATTVAGIAGQASISCGLALDGVAPRLALGTAITANYFDVLGVPLIAGRPIRAEEDSAPGGDPVMVLNEGLARAFFGAPEAAVGRAVLVNSVPFTVIGVTPAAFLGTNASRPSEFWIPGMSCRRANNFQPSSWAYGPNEGPFNDYIVRMAAGASLAQTTAELTARTRALRSYGRNRTRTTPSDHRADPAAGTCRSRLAPGGRAARDATHRGRRRTARPVGNDQCREPADLHRAGIGTRRGDSESARRERGQAAPTPPCREHPVDPSRRACRRRRRSRPWRLFADFALPGIGSDRGRDRLARDSRGGLSGGRRRRVCGRCAGTAGSSRVRHRRARARDSHRAAARRPAPARLGGRTGGSVVTLLVGALLFLMTLRHLRSMDLGFNPAGVTVVTLNVRGYGYTDARALEYQKQVADDVRQQPGIQAVGLAFSPPLFNGGLTTGCTCLARIRARRPNVERNGVSPDYFEAVRLPIVRGRVFTEAETSGNAETDAQASGCH